MSALKKGLLILGVVLLIGFLIWALVTVLERNDPAAQSVEATPAPELRKSLTAPVAIKKPVKTYAGDTKARLKLPPSVQADANEHVVSASQVRGNDRPQTVTTTINAETGSVTSYVKQDPYPWFAVETRGEIKLHYGYKADDLGRVQQVTRLGVNYDLVRVKALTAGVVLTADSDGSTFAGVGLTYRW